MGCGGVPSHQPLRRDALWGQDQARGRHTQLPSSRGQSGCGATTALPQEQPLPEKPRLG